MIGFTLPGSATLVTNKKAETLILINIPAGVAGSGVEPGSALGGYESFSSQFCFNFYPDPFPAFCSF